MQTVKPTNNVVAPAPITSIKVEAGDALNQLAAAPITKGGTPSSPLDSLAEMRERIQNNNNNNNSNNSSNNNKAPAAAPMTPKTRAAIKGKAPAEAPVVVENVTATNITAQVTKTKDNDNDNDNHDDDGAESSDDEYEVVNFHDELTELLQRFARWILRRPEPSEDDNEQAIAEENKKNNAQDESPSAPPATTQDIKALPR